MWLAPEAPIDRWNLFSPKKIATMVFALAVIQALGSVMAQYLGARTGSILTGFFGGLISSTATTASLGKMSKVRTDPSSGDVLLFLSATGAMLFEGLALVIAGTVDAELSILLIFIGPILATMAMIGLEYRAHTKEIHASNDSPFLILPIVKIGLFIIAILSISKLCQNMFGGSGLLVLTFLVSLFEIHGSVIASVQMHESGAISTDLLCSLLAISVVASYTSKLFLISALGTARLRSQTARRTFYLFCSVAISWAVAMTRS